MKKTLSLALVFIFVAQFVALPVQALEIVINSNGTTYFYEDQVLGKNSDEKEEEKEVEKEEKREVKEEKKEEHQELKIEKREIKIERKEEKRTDAPVKVIPNSTKNQIRVKQENAKTEVKIENKQMLKSGFQSQESTRNERVEIKMPAELKVERAEKRNELEATPQPGATPQPLEKVLEERRERKDEIVKIQSKINDDGTREFEFESRLIKAKAQGAEFVVDPATNNVTVITPSGQEHVLTHLPDQAVARLQNSGIVNTDAITDGTQELSIETKEDGSVVYKTKAQKVKKILGFINRKVETEVELDDQTGEITEEEVPASNWFNRFLNSMAN